MNMSIRLTWLSILTDANDWNANAPQNIQRHLGAGEASERLGTHASHPHTQEGRLTQSGQLQSHLAPLYPRQGIQQNPAQSDEAEDGGGNW